MMRGNSTGGLCAMFANGVECRLEIVGERGFKFHSFPGHRMVETEFQRMQRLASNQHFVPFFWKKFDEIRAFQRCVTFVKSVRDDRMTQMVHMHPQLVSPSGLWAQSHEGKPVEAFEDFIECRRMSGIPPFRADHHPFTIAVADANVRFDIISVKRNLAPGDCAVFLFDGSFFELTAEMVVNLIVLGDDQHSAGITVQSVDDPRS